MMKIHLVFIHTIVVVLNAFALWICVVGIVVVPAPAVTWPNKGAVNSTTAAHGGLLHARHLRRLLHLQRGAPDFATGLLLMPPRGHVDTVAAHGVAHDLEEDASGEAANSRDAVQGGVFVFAWESDFGNTSKHICFFT